LAGLIVTVLGLSHFAYLRWTRPQRVDIEMLSPAQTWMLWQELRLGANRTPSPAAKEAAKQELFHQAWTVFAVAVTAAGVLIIGTAYALIKPTWVRSSTRVPFRPVKSPSSRDTVKVSCFSPRQVAHRGAPDHTFPDCFS
jgi:hypothetical protein